MGNPSLRLSEVLGANFRRTWNLILNFFSLLMLVVYTLSLKNPNDATLASLSISIYPRWHPRWRPVISPRARNRFRLRQKGLKVCSYVEKCAEFKNQTLKKIGWYTKVLCATEYPGYAISQNSAKMGVPLNVYNINHVILIVKCKFCQQTIYNDQCST